MEYPLDQPKLNTFRASLIPSRQTISMSLYRPDFLTELVISGDREVWDYLEPLPTTLNSLVALEGFLRN